MYEVKVIRDGQCKLIRKRHSPSVGEYIPIRGASWRVLSVSFTVPKTHPSHHRKAAA